MIKQGLARLGLNQANFFKNCALEAISSQKRESFLNFFDAAIVFARSVTFFLQKEYRHTPGFNNWYLNKEELMKQDQIFSFFLTKRNIILKEGSAEVYRIVRVTGKAKIGFSSFVELSVIRGKLWYRRSPKILLGDLCAKIMMPMHKLICQCKIKLKNLHFNCFDRYYLCII